MTSDPPTREKIASRLPEHLRRQVKAAAAAVHRDLQDVLAEALEQWRRIPSPPTVDTSGAPPFGSWLPPGAWEAFADECRYRKISLVQGLAQAVDLWLFDAHRKDPTVFPQRLIVSMQKGGVGKTSTSAGLAQALAEDPAKGGLGLRVLVVDYDPQGDLTVWHGVPRIGLVDDDSQHSLTKHLLGRGKGQDIRDLLVPFEGDRFGGRLQLLPTCMDMFLLEASLGPVRMKEAALERALAPLEPEFDVVIIDSPPSLGLAMDAAVYYGRRRQGEAEGRSGLVMPVQAEDSSAEAFMLFNWQVEELCNAMSADVDYLGFVVNLYDSRRGLVATESLKNWKSMGNPRVLQVVNDRKEQREQVHLKEPLFEMAPDSAHVNSMRALAKELRGGAAA